MGKYDDVISRLPKMGFEKVPYQDRVNDTKARTLADEKYESRVEAAMIALDTVPKIDALDPEFVPTVGTPRASVIAARYRSLRLLKDRIEEIESDINRHIMAHEQLIESSFESEDVTMLRLADGGSIATQYEPSAVIEDKELFRLWCLDQKLEKMMTLPYQTANSLVKEKLLAGQPEPPGCKAYVRTKVVMRAK